VSRTYKAIVLFGTNVVTVVVVVTVVLVAVVLVVVTKSYNRLLLKRVF